MMCEDRDWLRAGFCDFCDFLDGLNFADFIDLLDFVQLISKTNFQISMQ